MKSIKAIFTSEEGKMLLEATAVSNNGNAWVEED